jgi:dihydrofolate reductase
MLFNLIVATCLENGIGYKGKLPWHVKADLQNFSKLTKGLGNAVIMGSNTLNSIPNKYLPGRDNLVLSTTQKFHTIMSDGHIIKSFNTIDAVIDFCKLMDYEEVWIIGGESIYKQFLNKNIINKCYITIIHKYFDCDTFFPLLDKSVWKKVEHKEEYDSDYDCRIDYNVFINHNTDCR